MRSETQVFTASQLFNVYIEIFAILCIHFVAQEGSTLNMMKPFRLYQLVNLETQRGFWHETQASIGGARFYQSPIYDYPYLWTLPLSGRDLAAGVRDQKSRNPGP